MFELSHFKKFSAFSYNMCACCGAKGLHHVLLSLGTFKCACFHKA
jgi:hypothetical protein